MSFVHCVNSDNKGDKPATPAENDGSLDVANSPHCRRNHHPRGGCCLLVAWRPSNMLNLQICLAKCDSAIVPSELASFV